VEAEVMEPELAEQTRQMSDMANVPERTLRVKDEPPPVDTIGPDAALALVMAAKKNLGSYGERMLRAFVKGKWGKDIEQLTEDNFDAVDEWMATKKQELAHAKQS
jgi:hypothetical protein